MDEKGKRRFTLWCASGGLINARHPSDEAQVVAFVEKCARHGVTHLVPTRGSRMLVEAAREKKIDVHPYLAFNSHGANREQYAWSVHYIGDPGSSTGADQLNRHRAIWSHPKTSVSLSDFAKQHPQYWARTKHGGDTLEPGQRLNLSLAVPEVRSYEVDRYLEIVNSSGGNGCQVEFVSTNTDQGGVGIYGYEDPVVKGFEEKYGQSPFGLLSDDTPGRRFRADLVTQTLTEIREKLKQEHPGAPFVCGYHCQGVHLENDEPGQGPLPQGFPRPEGVGGQQGRRRTIPVVSNRIGSARGGTADKAGCRCRAGTLSSDR